ncbi:uncharacterized protein LOC110447798 isoform X2 [Mizuhopecten yessoensis]|uniref:uncharacterized protein LOC110447798 isoform X2 n=1 Tax=Mizuhopecten yessoensis TaxID=6573 RepID=UPI000B45E8D6|nr:uncharacterized protein LOC110447798 isoform X2 [Mizuhopecten yessoensis]
MKMTDRTIGLKIIIVAMVLLQSATSDVKNESVMKEGADPNMVLLQSATSELKSESLMKEGADPNMDIKLKYQTHQTHQQIPMASCCGTDNSQLVRILKMIVQENKRILGGMRMPPLLQENEDIKLKYQTHQTHQQIPMASCCGTDNSQLVRILKMIVQENKRILGGMRMPPLLQENEDIKLKYQTHQTHQQIPMASCCGTDNSQLVRILKMIVQENKRILGGMRMPPLLQENEDIKLKYQTHQTHQQIPMASCCGTDNSQLVRILKMIVQENKRILGGMRMPPLLQENEEDKNKYQTHQQISITCCCGIDQNHLVRIPRMSVQKGTYMGESRYCNLLRRRVPRVFDLKIPPGTSLHIKRYNDVDSRQITISGVTTLHSVLLTATLIFAISFEHYKAKLFVSQDGDWGCRYSGLIIT